MEDSSVGAPDLSSLPDEVIDRILDYLPAKESAVMSTLSKSWNRLWISFPAFDFDFAKSKFFPTMESKVGFHENPRAGRRFHDFVSYVDDIIMERLRRGKDIIFVKRFNLSRMCKPSHVQIPSEFNITIDLWIAALAGFDLKELRLDIACEYKFPTLGFQLESLVSLSLVWLAVEENFSPEGIDLPHLQVLDLHHVTVSESVLEKIIDRCPSLERLSVRALMFPRPLRLVNLLSLKQLEVYKVRVYLDNLHNLEILNHSSYDVWPNLQVYHCGSVKEFTTFTPDCSYSEILDTFLSQFPLLERLTVTWHFMYMLEISNSQLMSLNLVNTSCDHDGLYILSPHLKFFAYRTPHLASSLHVPNIPGIQRTQLHLPVPYPISRNWLVKLRKYLSMFGKHDKLLLDLGSTCYVEKLESRGWVDVESPIADVKHVVIVIELEQEEWDCRCLLDALLCTCRPHSLSFKFMKHSGTIKLKLEGVVKFFQNKLEDGVDERGWRLAEVHGSCHHMAKECEWREDRPPSMETLHLTTTVMHIDKTTFDFVPSPPSILHFRLEWKYILEEL